jgi:ribosomal protein L32
MNKDKAFQLVRTYIKDHANADVFEISENTGVPLKGIVSFIKSGDLSMTDIDDSKLSNLIRCESCGIKIRSGRYCKSCGTKAINVVEKDVKGKVHLNHAKK